jgi:hypothetical protein
VSAADGCSLLCSATKSSVCACSTIYGIGEGQQNMANNYSPSDDFFEASGEPLCEVHTHILDQVSNFQYFKSTVHQASAAGQQGNAVVVVVPKKKLYSIVSIMVSTNSIRCSIFFAFNFIFLFLFEGYN